jgi:hypothetical protein
VVEDCVDEDGKMTIASVLTEVEVTVTVAASEEVESDDWEEHRTDRERKTSKEVNVIIQISVKVV